MDKDGLQLQMWRNEILLSNNHFVFFFKLILQVDQESVHHPFWGRLLTRSCSLIIKPGGSFCAAAFRKCFSESTRRFNSRKIWPFLSFISWVFYSKFYVEASGSGCCSANPDRRENLRCDWIILFRIFNKGDDSVFGKSKPFALSHFGHPLWGQGRRGDLQSIPLCWLVKW